MGSVTKRNHYHLSPTPIIYFPRQATLLCITSALIPIRGEEPGGSFCTTPFFQPRPSPIQAHAGASMFRTRIKGSVYLILDNKILHLKQAYSFPVRIRDLFLYISKN